ncbi:hypothetical protein [uncultured Winogradskyella sp.]|uniref:hypothetical protein n=1 Tax=uncultured Winogradskyella sp. TaxID=395353 RepID=UPI0026191D0F|nr:hypothetical protein [uncultured Winogradskyella sp.]
MKKIKSLFLVTAIIYFQSCLFGAGLVEREVTENYWLFANGYLHEMSLWYHPDDDNSTIVVDETVFAVGYDDDFIIAKSHPKDSINYINKEITYYHIILRDKLPEYNHIKLTKSEFKSIGETIGVPKNIEFTIIYSELE